MPNSYSKPNFTENTDTNCKYRVDSGGVLIEAVIAVPLVLLLIALVIGLGGYARQQALLDQISAQLTNYAAKSNGLSFAASGSECSSNPESAWRSLESARQNELLSVYNVLYQNIGREPSTGSTAEFFYNPCYNAVRTELSSPVSLPLLLKNARALLPEATRSSYTQAYLFPEDGATPIGGNGMGSTDIGGIVKLHDIHDVSDVSLIPLAGEGPLAVDAFASEGRGWGTGTGVIKP